MNVFICESCGCMFRPLEYIKDLNKKGCRMCGGRLNRVVMGGKNDKRPRP